jgi:transposase InsO family protein
MKFRFITENQGTFKVGRMCRLLNVSRSGYYAWLKRPKSRRSHENEKLGAKIHQIFDGSHRTYGSPRIHAELRFQGLSCGRNRVARLMRKLGIKAKTKRRFKATTDSKHNLPVASNLLGQNFEVAAPNKVWVADITYVPTQQGWLYLAVCMDLYSRMIVGWSMDSRITKSLVVDAFNMAIKNRPGARGLVHHSDRGSQYASHEFQNILQSYDMLCSMSRKGNCYDNAVAESFFHSLKTEWVHHYRYRTRQEAKTSIFEYIETFYNPKRRHSQLNYLSPADYEHWALAA